MSRRHSFRCRLVMTGAALVAFVAQSVLCLPAGGQAPGGGQKLVDPPHDLILVVDVSGSMIEQNDREGIRWDGLQFVVDIARPEDRIALVLFSGDAVIASQQIDPTGFVPLNKKYPKGTGRELLKQALEDLQEKETKGGWDKDTGEKGFTVNGKALKLWWGTSSMQALKTVTDSNRGLLKHLDSGHPAWVLLFTDGREERPFEPEHRKKYDNVQDHDFPRRLADYDYIKQWERHGPDELNSAVGEWVKEFREARVPIFCFALGAKCDERLLRTVSRQSQIGSKDDKKVGRAAGFYHSQTSRQLFEDLQKVAWELREYWRLSLVGEPQGNQDEFRTPSLGSWHEAGILLTLGTAEKKDPLLSPRDVTGPTAADRSVVKLEPLRSRSHWYYPLRPGWKKEYPGARDGLRLVVRRLVDNGKSYTPEAVAALRTETPLFTYMEPSPEGSYTPLDAIPFQIKFTPPAESAKFLSEKDFEVSAWLTPAGAEKPVRVVKLQALPAERGGITRLFRETEDVILDPNPGTEGKKGLIGPYDVDVTIRCTRKGLEMERQLIRKEIKIGPYPPVTGLGKPVLLTNTGKDPGRATFTVGLTVNHLGRNPNRVVAALKGELKRPLGKGLNGLKVTPEVSVRGGKAEFKLELSAASWADLPTGRHSGTIRLSGPGAGVDVDLALVKNPYTIIVEKKGPIVDLSSRLQKAAEAPVKVALDTPLETSEPVWLSKEKSATQKPAERPDQAIPLTFKDEKGGSREISVKGLGKLVTLTGGRARREETLSLTAVRPEKLPVGTYRAILHVVGPSINPATEVTVTVQRNPFPLTAPEVVTVDFSDRSKRKVDGEIRGVALATDILADEDIWLSNTARSERKPAATEVIKFKSRLGPVIDLKVSDLGKEVKNVPARASGRPLASIPFTLESTTAINPGLYEATLHLIGESVSSRDVIIRIVVDQPYVFRQDGKKTTPIDGTLALAVLAGTSLECDLAFGSALSGGKFLAGLKEKLPLDVSKTGRLVAECKDRGDRLPLAVVVRESTNGDRLHLEVKEVNRCIRDGVYAARIAFDTAAPGQAPRLIDLPIRVQVAQFGVQTDLKGPLRLGPPRGSPCEPILSGKVTLSTDVVAKQGSLRWRVKLDPLEAAAGSHVLEEGQLEALTEKNQNILGNKGAWDPISQKPLPLTIRARTSGLAPGLYRARLSFESTLDPASSPAREQIGASYKLEVEVLVPGREVRAEPVAPKQGKYQAGSPVPVRVTVICHGCSVGKGELHDLDPLSPSPVVAIDTTKPVEPPQQPDTLGRTVYTFLTQVRPHRAGPNRFEVRWEQACPEKGAAWQIKPFEVDAVGVIELRPAGAARSSRVVHTDEEVLLQVAIDPASSRPSPEELLLHAYRKGDKNGNPIEITLHDTGDRESGDARKGDGVFSGKHRFETVGEYEVGLPKDHQATLSVQPARVLVGFEYRHPVASAEMLYGGGAGSKMILVMMSNLESVTLKDVVSVKNQQEHDCHWKATVRFPRTIETSRTLKDQDVNALDLADEFDGRIDLDGRLKCQHCTGTVEPAGRGLHGVLKNGQELTLDLEASLSEDALSKYYDENSSEHLTLDQPNGLVVELELTWLDDKGQEVARRVLRAPVSITTTSWRLYGLIMGGVAALTMGGLGLWGYRRFQSWRRPKTPRVAADDRDLSTEGGLSAPPKAAAPVKDRGKGTGRPAEPPPPQDEDPGPPPNLSAGFDDI
jgi:hypothetical protein